MIEAQTDLAQTAIDRITATFTRADCRGVVVDSPPGAGKSSLVVRVATVLAAQGEQVVIIAQTNSQVDDLIVRFLTRHADTSIGRLSAKNYVPTTGVLHPSVLINSDINALSGCGVIVGTAEKWKFVTTGSWSWAIIDEAYQMRSDLLLRIINRFEHTLFVGDPGQLDPFSTVDIERWAGLSWDPMQSAVAVLLRHSPDTPVLHLPVSWRLPASAAPVVADAFYPFNPFSSGTGPDHRAMEYAPNSARRDGIDDVVALAASTGWGLHEMPARNTIRTDIEAVNATAAIAARLLHNSTTTYCEQAPDGRRLTAERIAVGAAHRDQVAALRGAIDRLGGDGITVDTANRLQGREYDATVILHPLSGRRDATEFHLESGRLCVLASRHRHACIVVAREGIPKLLDDHPSTEPMHLHSLIKFPDGWEANQSMFDHLGKHRIPAL